MSKFYSSVFNKYRLLFIATGILLGLMDFNTVSAQTVTTITSSQTWTVPAGVTSVKVEVWGGGGGGGGAYIGAGGGGGGGSYKTATFTVTLPGDNYTITIGAGGAGGPAWNKCWVQRGTTSTFQRQCRY